ncbi:MAG: hypothetical protein JJU22_16765 [Gammaproteobacteria bacterium]|nr:hypothetical protein [Gammaproteobacteria bacterium]
MDAIADRMITPLKVLLAILIVWAVADGIWFFLGGAETDVSIAADTTPRSATAQRQVASARDIADMELFGRAESAEVAAVDAPETRLQLELQGVFLGTADGTSSAIVAERNRDGRLFFVGDRMPGNAELVRVLEDRIVLRRGGALETLRFPEAGAARGFAASTAAGVGTGNDDTASDLPALVDDSDRAGAAGLEARRRPTPGSGGRQAGASDPAASTDLRELVSNYRQRLESDPDSALRDLGVEAVQLGDSQGYRVGNEASSADLARIGLRAGDVVLSVNGRQVTELQQDSAAVDGIIDSGTARLEIQRGERRFFVTTRIPRQ